MHGHMNHADLVHEAGLKNASCYWSNMITCTVATSHTTASVLVATHTSPIACTTLCRSLDWCATTELLLLIGAGQQAFERVAGVFLSWVEWVEKNMLGWDIPGEIYAAAADQ